MAICDFTLGCSSHIFLLCPLSAVHKEALLIYAVYGKHTLILQCVACREKEEGKNENYVIPSRKRPQAIGPNTHVPMIPYLQK